jgi:hypothetical protein
MSDPAAAPPPPPEGGFTPPPPAGAAAGVPGAALQLATPGKRFGAMLLEIVLAIVTLGIGWLIWSVIVWQKATSPAKSLMNMRVVKVSENRPATFGEMALRELVGKSLLANFTIGISYIIGGVMLINDKANHQALWDKMVETTVVEDPNNQFGL